MKTLGYLAIVLLLVGTAAGREWQTYGVPVAGEDSYLATELAHDDGDFERWGTAPSWATEEQVGFTLPAGGPWLLAVVRIWISGTAERDLLIRAVDTTVAEGPGAILAMLPGLDPGYDGPPDRWVEVDISAWDLFYGAGDELFVGVSLDGVDDGIGLDVTGDSGHSWGFYDGQWLDDSGDWSTNAGIRIVIMQYAIEIESLSWGAIKALYQS